MESSSSFFSSQTVTLSEKRKPATGGMQNFGKQRGNHAGAEEFCRSHFKLPMSPVSSRGRTSNSCHGQSFVHTCCVPWHILFLFFVQRRRLNAACTCEISQALQCTALANPCKQHARSQPPDAHCARPLLRSAPCFLVAGRQDRAKGVTSS